MEVVRAILADDPAMLLRESMGISADDSTKAFPSKHVDALLSRARLDYVRDTNPVNPLDVRRDCILIAVDPAGGGSSAFAVASMAQDINGKIMVCALCSSSFSSCFLQRPVPQPFVLVHFT